MTPLALTLVSVGAGVFGAVIGSFLNVVAYRVPAGISLLRESRCPACDEPVRWWRNVPVLGWLALRGRCARCRAAIPVRYPLVEALTAIVFAVVVAWGILALPGPPAATLAVIAAYLWFAASGIVLTLIDLDTRRLPHAITGSALIVCAALLGLAVLLGADSASLLRALGVLAAVLIAGLALVGAATLWAFYAAIRFVRPDGMGGGDVRLAAVVGLMLGWLGWGPLLVGAFAAFVTGGAFGVGMLLRRRAGRRTAIPFGPWIIVGAWIGVLAGDAIARAYTGLYPEL